MYIHTYIKCCFRWRESRADLGHKMSAVIARGLLRCDMRAQADAFTRWSLCLLTHARTHKRARTHTHTHTHTHAQTLSHAHTRTHILSLSGTRVGWIGGREECRGGASSGGAEGRRVPSTRACVYDIFACTYVRMYMYTYMCMCACIICIHIHIRYIHKYIHCIYAGACTASEGVARRCRGRQAAAGMAGGVGRAVAAA